MQVITTNDLIKLGYPKSTAQNIIRQAKKNMIEKGYTLYLNKRLPYVPVYAVEEILGITLSED